MKGSIYNVRGLRINTRTNTRYEKQSIISSTRGINNNVPSGWCVRNEFPYGKVQNPLKLYRGKDCIKKFCDHVIGEARRLYQSFPEVPMTPLTPKEMD